MSGEVETCNGGDALESNCTINCFKSEALDYSTGIGVGRDTGKGRTGSSDVFRTYKRRRWATTVSDSKPHDDGRASATLACQLADQDYTEKPDYGRCVAIVASASLREMIKPGALTIISPIAVGIVFRILGYYTGHPLLGAKVVASMLMFATVSGILMALFPEHGWWGMG